MHLVLCYAFHIQDISFLAGYYSHMYYSVLEQMAEPDLNKLMAVSILVFHTQPQQLVPLLMKMEKPL